MLLTIFLIIFIGVLAKKFLKIDENNLNNLVFYITAPALIFVSLYTNKLDSNEILSIALIYIILVTLLILIAKILLIAIKEKSNALIVPAAFANTTYIGYPVLLFYLGELGLSKGIIYDAFSRIGLFTIGVMLSQKVTNIKENILEIFKLPFLYAMIFGIFLNVLSFQIPLQILDVIKMVGNTTTTLVLILLGAKLSQVNLNLNYFKEIFVVMLVRLPIALLLVLIILSMFNLQPITKQAVLLQAIMPPAFKSYVINQKYDNKAEETATIVFLGTIINVLFISLAFPFLQNIL